MLGSWVYVWLLYICYLVLFFGFVEWFVCRFVYFLWELYVLYS